MQRVRPRYAIPFASNNCLLHDDVWAMNALVQTPIAMRDYFEVFARDHNIATKLQIMAPGDRWTKAPGDAEGTFDIAETDWQSNRAVRLAEYRDRVRPTLDRQARREARVTVPLAAARRFFADLSADLPGLFIRSLRGHKVLLVAKSEKAVQGFAVDLVAGTTDAVEPADFGRYPMRIEFPSLILLQALTMNMFDHAGISKRVHYYAPTGEMPALRRFVAALNLAEYELVPLSRHFNKRTVAAALPRWREGLLYARVLGQLARGRDFPTIEESLLQA
jgi:UDP-MurNAc hydroxylase